jgi:Cd2+/Zn2+-exporting ATPase
VVISIPAAILSAITSAARNGVLFKGGIHLEAAAGIRAIAFDKTGTLTIGRPRLVESVPSPGMERDELLRLAASAESLSEHPLSKAVVDGARLRGLTLSPAVDFQALIGKGVRARVGEQTIWVGKPELFTERGLSIHPDLAASAARGSAEGGTVVYAGDEKSVFGVLVLIDTLRESAAPAIEGLRRLGLKPLLMLTGDGRRVAEAIAGRLDMDFEAELLPEDKLRVIRGMREKYGSVAMVGDGINDAPSLAAANLGVSLGGTGTDVALETADIVLMGGDLNRLTFAVRLARSARVIIRQNLVFAFGMMAMLLAVTFFGSLRLPWAVVGHEGSTVLVILNGLRLLARRA